MDESSKSKWRVRVAALVVFIFGVTAGALALNVYRRFKPPRFDGSGSRRERFEQMLNRLQLNEEQKTQVRQILSDTRTQLQTLRKETEPRFDEIRHQADERLQKVLSPEQWKQFQQEREEMRRRGGPRGRGR